jgi:hypothetical protein
MDRSKTVQDRFNLCVRGLLALAVALAAFGLPDKASAQEDDVREDIEAAEQLPVAARNDGASFEQILEGIKDGAPARVSIDQDVSSVNTSEPGSEIAVRRLRNDLRASFRHLRNVTVVDRRSNSACPPADMQCRAKEYRAPNNGGADLALFVDATPGAEEHTLRTALYNTTNGRLLNESVVMFPAVANNNEAKAIAEYKAIYAAMAAYYAAERARAAARPKAPFSPPNAGTSKPDSKAPVEGGKSPTDSVKDAPSERQFPWPMLWRLGWILALLAMLAALWRFIRSLLRQTPSLEANRIQYFASRFGQIFSLLWSLLLWILLLVLAFLLLKYLSTADLSGWLGPVGIGFLRPVFPTWAAAWNLLAGIVWGVNFFNLTRAVIPPAVGFETATATSFRAALLPYLANIGLRAVAALFDCLVFFLLSTLVLTILGLNFFAMLGNPIALLIFGIGFMIWPHALARMFAITYDGEYHFKSDPALKERLQLYLKRNQITIPDVDFDRIRFCCLDTLPEANDSTLGGVTYGGGLTPPRVVLWTSSKLKDDEIFAGIVLHEIAHIARGDVSYLHLMYTLQRVSFSVPYLSRFLGVIRSFESKITETMTDLTVVMWTRLGGENLKTALKAIEGTNRSNADTPSRTHPALSDRIRLLDIALEQPSFKSTRSIGIRMQWIGAVVFVVILVLGFTWLGAGWWLNQDTYEARKNLWTGKQNKDQGNTSNIEGGE